MRRSSFYVYIYYLFPRYCILEPITVIVQYKIKRKKLAKAKEALSEYVEAVKNELGTTEYRVFQEKNDPTFFVHVMSFVDKNAKNTHLKTEHMKRLKNYLVPISKGKAVYTTLMDLKFITSQEKTEETKKDIHSHEPI
jgi:quinol monooxygenase YgiN